MLKTMYEEQLVAAVDELKAEGRYRVFRHVLKDAGKFPVYLDEKGSEITVWCTNDYLGCSVNKQVVDAMCGYAMRHGVGAGGTRNIAGSSIIMQQTEQKIANFHGKEAGLIFTSGYVCNAGAIATLIKLLPKVVVFSDAKNHASIIAGIKVNKPQVEIFHHNNVAHLEELLRKYPKEQNKIIIFESVYSMDGTIADVKNICDLAKKYNALTYVDEVHGVGLYGKNGSGVCNMLSCDGQIDVVQGTFGKAFGVIGGYITGSKILIDAVRGYCADFIFTTALPPAIIAAINASIDVISNADDLRQKQQDNVKYLRNLLNQNNIKHLVNNSHIVPIMVNDAKKAEELSLFLFYEHQIYAQHINYPTVPKGTERLRITPTPFHTKDMARKLAFAIKSFK
jgi:5-aminolevulinate synthase